ncbi:muconolactone Delta-isomerase [Sinomonas cyclohexanicum]|uniref:Muconolactone Delta-isomerase n=1 Tax=Sinomonas cyclohexanicum TaxID=322009 RepID=A0ABN6FMB5_SINCY|nr:muconolactone Delta-isomerase [Corynebacterium cyclohexanicum]BCT77947.1 muconolactone Delta-isomerase [Corynebacterium cyclohexanicum]
MLFMARMDVTFPPHLTPEQVADFQAREKEYSGSLQRSGKMAGIWRIVGEYANHSLFDVDSNDELHEILSGFPMYPYMTIRVTPLAKHPNSIS